MYVHMDCLLIFVSMTVPRIIFFDGDTDGWAYERMHIYICTYIIYVYILNVNTINYLLSPRIYFILRTNQSLRIYSCDSKVQKYIKFCILLELSSLYAHTWCNCLVMKQLCYRKSIFSVIRIYVNTRVHTHTRIHTKKVIIFFPHLCVYIYIHT